MTVLLEIARLKRLTWSALDREALSAGLTPARIREATTLDELRLAILKARFPEVDVEAGVRG